MRKDEYIQNKLLLERIEQNYKDFQTTNLSDADDVLDAPKIAAVYDAYFYLIMRYWGDAEAKYLLNYENPLMLLAYKWAEYTEDRGKDFGRMLTDLAETGGGNYIPAAAVCCKCGGNAPQ